MRKTCLTITFINFALQLPDHFLHALELFHVATTLAGQLLVLGDRVRVFLSQFLAFLQRLSNATRNTFIFSTHYYYYYYYKRKI